MPASVPRGSEFSGVMEVSSARAQAWRLSTRLVAQTANDTLACFATVGGSRNPLKASLSAERGQDAQPMDD
jgi:hypothetical protein